MSLEEAGPPPNVRPQTRTNSVRIVPARTTLARPEIREANGWLEVTLAAPDIPEESFRYAVGRRYLAIWSDDGSPEQQHFLVLPKRLETNRHRVRFRNGVVDARLKVAPHRRRRD